MQVQTRITHTRTRTHQYIDNPLVPLPSFRCGGMFCAIHRYAETHSCTFDYKTEGRRMIARENPIVMAPKLPKIWHLYLLSILNGLYLSTLSAAAVILPCIAINCYLCESISQINHILILALVYKCVNWRHFPFVQFFAKIHLSS